MERTKSKMFSDVKDRYGVPLSASVEGFAACTGRTPRTCRYMAANGRIPATKVGQSWLVNLPEALKALGLYPTEPLDKE